VINFLDKNFHGRGGEPDCGKGKAELSAVEFEQGASSIGMIRRTDEKSGQLWYTVFMHQASVIGQP